MQRKYCLAILLSSVASVNVIAGAQTIETAKDYYLHGLDDKAKDLLITALHAPTTTPANKAKALYLLGTISYEEGHIRVAASDWQTLAKDYPGSTEAKEITNRLGQLREIATKISDESVTSAVASSYISNGDFWSGGDKKFLIDSSWLSHTDLAVDWYDRAIKEFADSDAAEVAYRKKLFVFLGARGSSRDDESTGLQGNYQKYLPEVLATFSSLETAYPIDSSLQAFRYQIAQAYWGHKDWANARLWFQKIIDKGEGEHTFYTETARARLQKIEF